jgi:hypothetical protein
MPRERGRNSPVAGISFDQKKGQTKIGIWQTQLTLAKIFPKL